MTYKEIDRRATMWFNVQFFSGLFFFCSLLALLFSLMGLVEFGLKAPSLGAAVCLFLAIASNRPVKTWYAREQQVAAAWKKKLEDVQFFLGLVSRESLEKLIISKMWGELPTSTVVPYARLYEAGPYFPSAGFREHLDSMLWNGSIEFATICEPGESSRIKCMAFKIGEKLLERARREFPLEDFEIPVENPSGPAPMAESSEPTKKWVAPNGVTMVSTDEIVYSSPGPVGGTRD